MGLDAEQILKYCYDSDKQALRIATDGLVWTKYTYTMGASGSFSAANTTQALNGPVLPAGTCVHAVKVKPSVRPAGSGLTTTTFSVGITGTVTKYVNAYDIQAAVAEGLKTLTTNDTAASRGVWMENHSSTTQVVLTLTTGVCLISALTAGTVDVWILTSIAT